MNEALNIMIVEDSGLTRNKLKAMLEKLGHRVIAVADDGRQAVELYGEHLPDLVTMDITMPDIDGIEATKRIVRDYPDAVIMMITSHGHQQKVIKAIHVGAKGYLLKPITEEKLVEQIDQVVSRIS
ncbi:MAG: response regulator [Opitutales bacterium]